MHNPSAPYPAVVFQLLSHVQFFVTPWSSCQASLSFTISQRLLKLMSIESVMPSNHLNLCCLLLLLHSIFPSIRVFPVSQLFTSGGQNIGSFSFSISPSNKCSGLISFRMDWLAFFSVQGTLSQVWAAPGDQCLHVGLCTHLCL